MAQKNMSSATMVMLGALAGIGGSAAGFSLGTEAGLESAWQTLEMLCLVFVPLVVGGLVADIRKNHQMKSLMNSRTTQLIQIAQRYNAVTQMLERSYKEEKRGLGLFDQARKSSLRRAYEQKYNQNRAAYERERLAYIASVSTETPQSRSFKRYWKWVVALGLVCQMAACSYTVGSYSAAEAARQPQTLTPQADMGQTLWNADNLPIPYLKDSTRYVSNPDGVVTASTEAQLNLWFRKMEDSLQVQSIVAIVNHVENDDPFRMAQDLGNKYGVGHNDRGLIIILAYGDHALNISPGRSLEADLTDVECHRLEQRYAVPCMKAELPDSGMLYLAEAIYNTLQSKQLPTMQLLSSGDDDKMLGPLAVYFLLLGGWLVLIAWLYSRYVGTSGRNLLHSNPFVETAAGSAFIGTGGGSRGGGFGGGGRGFSGGSFGGGSFGGGGATARW